MMIIGVDYHPSFQAIAFLMEEAGECGEQELKHSDGQAEKFYRDLQQRGICVRVGMEATGYSLLSRVYCTRDECRKFATEGGPLGYGQSELRLPPLMFGSAIRSAISTLADLSLSRRIPG